MSQDSQLYEEGDGMPDRLAPAVQDTRRAGLVSTSRPAGHSRWRGVGVGQVMAAVCLAAGLVWGAWATRAILDLRRGPAPIVKVRLQGLIQDYVRAEARSATPPDRIGPDTSRYMELLDAAIARHARAGQLVLVSEAVAGGEVEDITSEIKREVYAHIAGSSPPTTPPPSSSGPQGHQEIGNAMDARTRNPLPQGGAGDEQRP